MDTGVISTVLFDSDHRALYLAEEGPDADTRASVLYPGSLVDVITECNLLCVPSSPTRSMSPEAVDEVAINIFFEPQESAEEEEVPATSSTGISQCLVVLAETTTAVNVGLLVGGLTNFGLGICSAFLCMLFFMVFNLRWTR